MWHSGGHRGGLSARFVTGALGLVALSLAWDVGGAEAIRSTFAVLPDGVQVEAVDLRNAHGLKVRVITLGATVQSIFVPDRRGVLADVTLGYDRAEDYLRKPHYFGATIGRFANRIAQGRFVLDGKSYQLPINSPPNCLHGGPQGFDKVIWTIARVDRGSVSLSHVSAAGDQGFPGALHATATFTLLDTDELAVDYRATTDQPTVVNLTNHIYFNLAGSTSPDDVLHQLLTIPAKEFIPVDINLIPTGVFQPVGRTPFDFRSPHPIGSYIRDDDEQLHVARGYDHNFVISRRSSRHLRPVARVVDPGSGRGLEVLSDQAGLQVYTGNFLDGSIVGKAGRAYRQGDALVLEPQGFPDSPNQPGLGSARLNPGQTYLNRIRYRFFIVGR